MIHFIVLLFIFCVIVREIISVLKISKSRKKFINDKDLNVSCIKLPSFGAELCKRLFDIVVVLVVCLTILPILFIVLGIIIKTTSSGSIIFSQKRAGIL